MIIIHKTATIASRAAKIAASAVTAAKIDADAITTAKIAASAVTAAKIDADAITTAKIAASAVTADKLAASALDYIKEHGYEGGELDDSGYYTISVSGYIPDGGVAIPYTANMISLGLKAKPTDSAVTFQFGKQIENSDVFYIGVSSYTCSFYYETMRQ